MPVASILAHFSLTLGRGLQLCLRGGNNSWIHVDFTIGSDQMNIDALTVDDRREALMRNGERAFTL